MVASFGPIFLAVLVATVFALLPIAISTVFVPKRPDRVKNAPYECGVEPIGPATVQVPAKFYLYALIFVIFDIEAVFLFPWAVTFDKLGLYALVEMAIFIGLLMIGYAYAWRKRALEWA